MELETPKVETPDRRGPAPDPAKSWTGKLPGPLSDPKVIAGALAFALGFGLGLQVMERMTRGKTRPVAVRARCPDCDQRAAEAATRPVPIPVPDGAPAVSGDDPNPAGARTFSAGVTNGQGPHVAPPATEPTTPGLIGPDRPQTSLSGA